MCIRDRYQTQLGLPEYDAGIITGQKALVDFFEEVTALGVPAKEAANWMLGDMMRRLKEEELEPKDMRLTPATLVKLIGMVQAGRINRNTASKVFRGIFAEALDPEEWVTVHGLEPVSYTHLSASRGPTPNTTLVRLSARAHF